MNNAYQGHICIVFALEHYNPLGLIRSLGENGIRPVYFAIKRRAEIASKSKYISRCLYADTVEEGYRMLLEEYGGFDYDHRPFLLFSDDKSMGYFDLRYDELKEKFILFNAGQSGRINEFMNKQRILELAQECGFQTLPSYVVPLGVVPEGLQYPIITKDITPNSGSWKDDVFICENEEELRRAYQHITSPIVQLQRFVDKKNECALQGFSARQGKDVLIAVELSWKYQIKGYYSPYQTATEFHRPEMYEKLKKLFETVGYEGIFEVEFLIDKDGTFYFLEVNFRASCWNYSATAAGMPMAYLWVKSMLNGAIGDNDRRSFRDFTALCEPIDYGKRVDTGMVSVSQWMQDFAEARCRYYFNTEDLEPYKVLFDKWDVLK